MTMPRTCLSLAVILLAATSLWAGDAEDEALKKLDKFLPKVVRDKKAPNQPVVSLQLGGPKVTDAELALLTVFRELRELDLNSAKIEGPGLKHLQALERLETLNLPFTPVCAAGVPFLVK